MKKVLILCPTERDERELALSHVKKGYQPIFYTYDNDTLGKVFCDGIGLITKQFNTQQIIEELVTFCEQENIEGIFSSEDYPGSIFAHIVAERLGLPGAHPETVLLCQHKFHARQEQQKYVPHAVPEFCLINPNKFEPSCFNMQFPVFVKPVKAYFSFFANSAYTMIELKDLLQTIKMPDAFIDQFNWFLKNYSACNTDVNNLLVEDLLEGMQTTLEGYVYNGQVHILGITDSIMFPGTISFSRFEYPSSVPKHAKKKMITTAIDFMSGIDFDNSFFNIEFMYNPKTEDVHIIEVNPRLVSQFADLYEKVDGINSYQVALPLAVGQEPVFKKGGGTFDIAGSLVLRIFEDKKIEAMPEQYEIDELHKRFPEIRIQLYGVPGQKLSDQFQDGKSYRYGLIHLGARDRQELLEKFEECKQLLTFGFESI